MVTRASMAALMAPFLKKVMLDKYNMLDWQYKKLYNIATSDKQFETMLGITGFGLVPERPEGTGVLYDDPIQGFSVKYVHVTYGLGYQITKEAIEDDQYKVLGKRMAEQLGKSAHVTKEILGAKIFNEGFTVANGPDGKPLFSTTHLLVAGGTAPNRPTNPVALSSTSLQNAMISFRRQVDDRGKQIMVRPQTLVVAPELEYKAYELLNSTLVPDSANNNTNSLKGALDILVMDYLTSPTAWFLAAGNGDHGLTWYNRSELDQKDTEDFDTGNHKYKAEWRSSNGFNDWRGLWGSQGA